MLLDQAHRKKEITFELNVTPSKYMKLLFYFKLLGKIIQSKGFLFVIPGPVFPYLMAQSTNKA